MNFLEALALVGIAATILGVFLTIYVIYVRVNNKIFKETRGEYRNPIPTVDIIIEFEDKGIILINRKNPPYGWAIPGGFVDYGESLEETTIREAKEETALDIELIKQFHTYSDPKRDPRYHTITTVYIARATGTPRACDDAKEIGIFTQENLPSNLAFDHEKILKDYFSSL